MSGIKVAVSKPLQVGRTNDQTSPKAGCMTDLVKKSAHTTVYLVCQAI